MSTPYERAVQANLLAAARRKVAYYRAKLECVTRARTTWQIERTAERLRRAEAELKILEQKISEHR